MRSGSRSSRQRSPRSRVRDLRARTPRAVLVVLAVLVGMARAARADAADDRRALIMLRVLAYDNHLRERAGDQVGIVIVYPAGEGGAAERNRPWCGDEAEPRPEGGAAEQDGALRKRFAPG